MATFHQAGERPLPRISILMPCRNGRRFIAEAIASIREQAYPDLEHIVLDACSTDGTLSILESCPDVVVVSEPDSSAHEAMNKGIARATGEIIGFLGIDDLYPAGALNDVGRLFAARPDVDLVAGHALVFEDGTSGRRIVAEYIRPRGFGLAELMFSVSGFYGIFFRRRVFDRLGGFDERFDFTADVHFLLRAILEGFTAASVDRPTVLYRMHPDSRTINRARTNRLTISRERFRMAVELAQSPSLRPQDRRLLRTWSAFEGAKLTMLMLGQGQTMEALRVSGELCRTNPLWPVRLPQALALRRSVRPPHRPAVTPA